MKGARVKKSQAPKSKKEPVLEAATLSMVLEGTRVVLTPRAPRAGKASQGISFEIQDTPRPRDAELSFRSGNIFELGFATPPGGDAAPRRVRDGPTYVAWVVDEQGRRAPIRGRRVVVEVGNGDEVEIPLFAASPDDVGKLWLVARAGFVITPLASNSMLVSLPPNERRFPRNPLPLKTKLAGKAKGRSKAAKVRSLAESRT